MNEDYKIEELATWLVILITMVGGGLRVFLVGNNGLWSYETINVWLSSHTVVDMLQWLAKIDQHPPLYYLLLHFWIAFMGNTAANVRLLSVIFGTATIPFIYLIGKRMSGAMIGLAAALFFAISPFNIRFAQETLMYTLLTFNASVAIYALVRLLTDSRSVTPIGNQFRQYLHAWRTLRPAESDTETGFSYEDKTRDQTGWRAWIYRHRWLPIQNIETDLAWIVFILFSAATLYSHNAALLFPIATNIFVFGLLFYQKIKNPASPPAFQAPSFSNWIKAQVGIFIIWCPWIVAFIKQANRVNQEFGITKLSLDTVLQSVKSFLNDYTFGQSGQVTLIWILYGLLLFLGLVYFRKKISQFLFLVALFFIPFLGELIVSLGRPFFYDLTLIWTTIPLFLVLAAGIAQLRFRVLIFVVVGILVTNNLFSTSDFFRFRPKEDWSKVAGFVANFAKKDDLVLFNATWTQIPFDYYFKYYEELYSIQVDKHGVPVDLFASGVREPKMEESDIARLDSLLSGKKVVWLIYSRNTNTDPLGLIPQTLASKLKLIYVRDFSEAQVQLYIVP
jgi:Dolichyl-phosphate-mannose-protein mannosyltransferase